MKTLILVSLSKFITDNSVDEFLPKKIKDSKIAYITTAFKKTTDLNFIEAIDKQKQKMVDLKFNFTEIDIEGKAKIELKQELSKYDIIMVEGGNAFFLLKTARESGFDNVIKELVGNGVVYIGVSAGSYLVCPSIIISTWSKRAKDKFGIIDYTGVNLVPFLIKAHYTPDMFDELKEIKKELKYPLYLINDNQGIVIKNNNIKFIGKGEEIIL